MKQQHIQPIQLVNATALAILSFVILTAIYVLSSNDIYTVNAESIPEPVVYLTKADSFERPSHTVTLYDQIQATILEIEHDPEIVEAKLEPTKEQIAAILSATQDYADKADLLAQTYVYMSEDLPTNMVYGIMANVYAEGKPGCVEGGVRIKNWNGNGKYSSSRLNGTDYLYVSSKANVEAMYNDAMFIWYQCSPDSKGYRPESERNYGSWGVGICGWTGENRIKLADVYKETVTDYSDIEQITQAELMLLHDAMTENVYGTIKQKDFKTLQAYRSANKVAAGNWGALICKHFEKPSDMTNAMKRRYAIAEELKRLIEGES